MDSAADHSLPVHVPQADAAVDVAGRVGRRTLLVGSLGAVAGTAAASMLGAGTVGAATSANVFEPVTPSLRLADTRSEEGAFGFSRVAGTTIRVGVAGRTVDGVTIPSDAVAAVFSVVGINLDALGNFLTTYPSRTARPTTSNLNVSGFRDIANNLVTVKLGTDGAAEFYTFRGAEIIVDLLGVYRPAGGATREGRFEPLGGVGGNGPAARRIFSPEQNGNVSANQRVDVDVSSIISSGLVEGDATAIVANITVARPGSRGFATAWPYGEDEPSTSSLNFTGNSIRAANSFVRLGTDPQTGRRGFHVRVTSGARLYVDVSGYITGTNARFKTTDGQFVPVTPQRILDTRSSNTSLRGIGGGKRLWRGWSRAFGLPSSVRSSAGAVAVNLTMVRTMNPGWLTLLPARTARQEVSNVNSFFNGQVAANHAVTPVSSTGLEVYSSGGSSVVCDLVGYFLGRTVPETMPLLPDPPPQAVGPPYTLSIPRTGTRHSMVSGLSSVQVVDTGRIWHWTGTGMVGQGASIGAFGHRTDAGGPFRNIHFLRAGDRITIDTIDQRRYTYEYSGRELTSERDEEILAAAYREPGEMVSLIACTVGFDSSKSAFPDRWAPTSLRWRIVVRLRLVGWEDIAPLE